METTKLGAFIRRRREELGMTQQDLANRVGVTPQQIHNIEVGKTRDSTPDTLNPIARALRVPVETLLALVGYDVGPADFDTVFGEVERIRQLPAEERMTALAQLDPVIYGAIQALFVDWLQATLQTAQTGLPSAGSRRRDSQNKGANGQGSVV